MFRRSTILTSILLGICAAAYVIGVFKNRTVFWIANTGPGIVIYHDNFEFWYAPDNTASHTLTDTGPVISSGWGSGWQTIAYYLGFSVLNDEPRFSPLRRPVLAHGFSVPIIFVAMLLAIGPASRFLKRSVSRDPRRGFPMRVSTAGDHDDFVHAWKEKV